MKYSPTLSATKDFYLYLHAKHSCTKRSSFTSIEETKKGFDDSRPPWKSRKDIGFNLLDRSTGRNSRTKGRIDCHRLMRKSQERAGQQWHVLYGKTGKSRHLDASMEGATRDFMSRNSLGSPTFMFYPVIMMSTYTLDKTKHYLTSFLFVGIRSSSFLARFQPCRLPVDVFVARNRNLSATRKCLAFLRPVRNPPNDERHSFAFISSLECLSIRYKVYLCLDEHRDRRFRSGGQLDRRLPFCR